MSDEHKAFAVFGVAMAVVFLVVVAAITSYSFYSRSLEHQEIMSGKIDGNGRSIGREVLP